MSPAVVVVSLLLGQAPVAAEAAPSKGAAAEVAAPVGFRLHVGAHLGLPILVGLGSTGTFFVGGRPRFDVDAFWEPSGFLQSYSVGGAWHPLDSAFFVGPRLRLLQFQPPWTSGFNGAQDHHVGVSLEGGLRLRMGAGASPAARPGVVTIALSGTFVPTQSVNLQWLLGLTAGVSWSVFSR
ncbi:MAG: hypothetical protein INH41_10255 [Myxococcaceae bacterium]|jgi:hypothetical protein|nr:hypothetical protein [Myxococcaceae bacterium]MCA3012765.1 hypothetical protein [Myxococcaceae bacterium]